MKTNTLADLVAMGYEEKNAEKTCRKNTLNTYKAVMARLAPAAGARVLDYGAGHCHGTAWMRAEGFQADGHEPFCTLGDKPAFSAYDASDVPAEAYDVAVALYVVNVMPHDVALNVVRAIYSKMKPGAVAVIASRSWPQVKKALATGAGAKQVGENEIITSHGTFQKGHSAADLVALVMEALGDKAHGVAPFQAGDTAVTFTK